jgi:hypothetical protein
VNANTEEKHQEESGLRRHDSMSESLLSILPEEKHQEESSLRRHDSMSKSLIAKFYLKKSIKKKVVFATMTACQKACSQDLPEERRQEESNLRRHDSMSKSLPSRFT